MYCHTPDAEIAVLIMYSNGQQGQVQLGSVVLFDGDELSWVGIKHDISQVLIGSKPVTFSRE